LAEGAPRMPGPSNAAGAGLRLLPVAARKRRPGGRGGRSPVGEGEGWAEQTRPGSPVTAQVVSSGSFPRSSGIAHSHHPDWRVDRLRGARPGPADPGPLHKRLDKVAGIWQISGENGPLAKVRPGTRI
jgi:hypothetical protein